MSDSKKSMSRPLEGKRILFVIADDFTFRIRQYKEAMSLFENGAQIIFLCMGEADSPIWESAPFEIITMPKYSKKPHYSQSPIWLVRVGLNLTVFELMRKIDLFKERRQVPKFIKRGIELRPHAVHAVDLGALKICAEIANATGAKLVYDSCDYWSGFLKNPLWKDATNLAEKLALDEKENIAKADLVLVTGKTMLSRLSADYDIATCRIIYNSVNIESSKLGNGEIGKVVRFVYHGAIIPDRNVDKLIAVFSQLPNNATLDIFGEFISCNRSDFEKMISDFHLQDRVRIHGKFDFQAMLDFLPTYDVGIYLAQKTDGNFDITVPTKLFDCVCAGLAVVMPDFESIKDELEDVHCGITVNTDDDTEIVAAVTDLIKNPKQISQYKRASRNAEPKYNWASQGRRLVEMYESLFQG